MSHDPNECPECEGPKNVRAKVCMPCFHANREKRVNTCVDCRVVLGDPRASRCVPCAGLARRKVAA